MSNKIMVNKSGSNYPVYDTYVSGKTQIGTIYNREAYVLTGESESGVDFCIKFKNSSGGISEGFLYNVASTALTECCSYPYGSVVINGTTYKTFYMREGCTVYSAGGSVWGSVATGRKVACLTSLSGDNNPTWKAINYVENTSGVWVAVTADSANYGYVNFKLESASSYSTVKLYGSW